MADERPNFETRFRATKGNAPKFVELVGELCIEVDRLRAERQRVAEPVKGAK